MTRYCLTRVEPKSLEEAFALALREDYTTRKRVSAPEPMEIDAIEVANNRSHPFYHGGRWPSPISCFRCRKPGHRAAECHVPPSAVSNCSHCPRHCRCSSCSSKKRPGPVGAGRPTSWNGGPSTPVATQPPSPVVDAHFNDTSASDDTRLIIISIEVAGSRSPIRTLLDSGASHNFIRASCMSLLPESTTVRGFPGKMVIKLADGKTHRMSRPEVVLPYMFDGFQSGDTITVIETNHPKINWLALSVKRRGDIDVSDVFTHLLVSPSDWPHVTVVDQLSTTQSMDRVSDGSLRVHDIPARGFPWRRGKNNIAVEQGIPHVTKVTVEQGLPHGAVRRGLPYDDSTGAVDHNLLHLEEVNALQYVEGGPRLQHTLEVAISPKDAKSIAQLPGLSWKHFLRGLKAGEIEQICLISDADSVAPMVNATSASDDISTRPMRAEPKAAREERSETQSRESGNPTAAFITRSISRPEQSAAFRGSDRYREINRRQAGHAPNPRKDMVLGSTSGSVIYSAIDLTDGFNHNLIRECDIPLTAVSTPNGMLWEWLVIPQGLKNAPATFNRIVSHILRPRRDFAPSYFDDIFVHSRAEEDFCAVDVLLQHLWHVFQRDNKLYANLKKCIFSAPEIPVLGYYVSKNGVRENLEKIPY
ncbi:LOW QUALITY PROTEIN: polyprotein [Phytophthora megakarya]|uniref:Polyprotein n=1 Tax=Phytophthora megakarya TaxID=4795 RepID=A0A225VYY5_9STRA|nr:LOW QUALITY PROTEIN: polyprotein [Phytophthora megakarya]